jgi:hypothetical protein
MGAAGVLVADAMRASETVSERGAVFGKQVGVAVFGEAH